eukprot:jgi/Mesvir1/17172/Mv07594-RA.1
MAELLLEEPVRLASILDADDLHGSAKPFRTQTKIIATLGPESHTVEILEKMLRAGMNVARVDFSWGDADYHQETIDRLRQAVINTGYLCATMMDTAGPEINVTLNPNAPPIIVQAGQMLELSTDTTRTPSETCLPVSFPGLAKACQVGTEVFVGQYLFTGSETSSVWLEVDSVSEGSVMCRCKNTATLGGSLLTVQIARVVVDMPTLSEKDVHYIKTWGVANGIDFISLAFTRTAQDIHDCRKVLKEAGLSETRVIAKIENLQGFENSEEILEASDGIIISRGSLGIEFSPEKMFMIQKMLIHRANMAGKPVILTRVVDTMTDAPRPTRAEATDVANAVLDGADAILLGAETVRGRYPIQAVSTVLAICQEAERVFNHSLHYKRVLAATPLPMSHLDSMASSAVRCADKIKASLVIVFTESGKAARLLAKYRPPVPILTVVVPVVTTDQLTWHFTGQYPARQTLISRGLFPVLASRQTVNESGMARDEFLLNHAIHYGIKHMLINPHDLVVVSQRSSDGPVVKIVEVEGAPS